MLHYFCLVELRMNCFLCICWKFAIRWRNFYRTQGLPRVTQFLEAVLQELPEWRQSLNPFPVLSWPAFIAYLHQTVNPLAGDEHLKVGLNILRMHTKGRTILRMRQSLNPFLVLSWPAFTAYLHQTVNPLAGDEHLKVGLYCAWVLKVGLYCACANP